MDEIVNLSGFVCSRTLASKHPPGWLRVGLTFIIPVAFAVTIPSQCANLPVDTADPGWHFFLTIIFIMLGRFFWRRGLKPATSA